MSTSSRLDACACMWSSTLRCGIPTSISCTVSHSMRELPSLYYLRPWSSSELLSHRSHPIAKMPGLGLKSSRRWCSKMTISATTVNSKGGSHQEKGYSPFYIVCLYQNWDGTDPSKRRIRRFRFSTMVAVARDIGIPYARHSLYSSQSSDDFDWAEYVL